MTEKQINKRIRHLIRHSNKLYKRAEKQRQEKHYIAYTEINNSRMQDIIHCQKWFSIRKELWGY